MSGAARVPLVVDLDGTLTRSDLLIESFFALLTTHPLTALKSLATLRQGKAAFKAAVAAATPLEAASVPLNDAVVDWLTAEKAAGRPIYLATASNVRLAEPLAAASGLFDGVLASDGALNLGGDTKARVLVERFGRQGFAYAGNARADLPVWQEAAEVIVVNAGRRLTEEVQARHPAARVLSPKRPSLTAYRKALRVHQWLKNLLIFAPAFAAHHFDFSTGLRALAAFVSFSLCASSVYVLNDLLDLRSDRDHATKRHRPFASGTLGLDQGILLGPAALLGALAIGLFLPGRFLAVLVGYYVVTLGYSTFLKRQAIVDVLTLAGLYGVRLLAGAAATSVPLSSWILTFSVFLFLSLALIKRCSELRDRLEAGRGDPAGRGYRLTDLPALQGMAAASGNVSVLTCVLYLNSPAVTGLYGHPAWLWVIPMVLLYWISRVLILTHRGEMHEDPVLFAAGDRVSWGCLAVIALTVLASIR